MGYRIYRIESFDDASQLELIKNSTDSYNERTDADKSKVKLAVNGYYEVEFDYPVYDALASFPYNCEVKKDSSNPTKFKFKVKSAFNGTAYASSIVQSNPARYLYIAFEINMIEVRISLGAWTVTDSEGNNLVSQQGMPVFVGKVAEGELYKFPSYSYTSIDKDFQYLYWKKGKEEIVVSRDGYTTFSGVSGTIIAYIAGVDKQFNLTVKYNEGIRSIYYRVIKTRGSFTTEWRKVNVENVSDKTVNLTPWYYGDEAEIYAESESGYSITDQSNGSGSSASNIKRIIFGHKDETFAPTTEEVPNKYVITYGTGVSEVKYSVDGSTWARATSGAEISSNADNIYYYVVPKTGYSHANNSASTKATLTKSVLRVTVNATPVTYNVSCQKPDGYYYALQPATTYKYGDAKIKLGGLAVTANEIVSVSTSNPKVTISGNNSSGFEANLQSGVSGDLTFTFSVSPKPDAEFVASISPSAAVGASAGALGAHYDSASKTIYVGMFAGSKRPQGVTVTGSFNNQTFNFTRTSGCEHVAVTQVSGTSKFNVSIGHPQNSFEGIPRTELTDTRFKCTGDGGEYLFDVVVILYVPKYIYIQRDYDLMGISFIQPTISDVVAEKVVDLGARYGIKNKIVFKFDDIKNYCYMPDINNVMNLSPQIANAGRFAIQVPVILSCEGGVGYMCNNVLVQRGGFNVHDEHAEGADNYALVYSNDGNVIPFALRKDGSYGNIEDVVELSASNYSGKIKLNIEPMVYAEIIECFTSVSDKNNVTVLLNNGD